MKYVTGEGAKIRVIALPEDARPLTAEDEAVLKRIEADRQAKERERKERERLSEARAEILGRIAELKSKLRRTDYQAIKYAEGEMTADEYSATKALRSEWRAEINELEGQI